MDNPFFNPTVQVDMEAQAKRRRLRKVIEQQLARAENTLRHTQNCPIFDCVTGCDARVPDKIVSAPYVVEQRINDAALDHELPGTYFIE